MKKQYISLIIIMLLGLTYLSCEYDEDEILQGYQKAAVPVVTDITSSFFNLLDLDNANIAFTLDKKGVPTNSISIQKTFNGQTVTHGEVSNFPANLNISLAEAISGFQGVSLNDLEVGDVISFSFLVNTEDGRTIRSGVAVDAPVSCPSELEGTYEVFIAASNKTYTLQITADGAGQYSIENFNLDFQPDFYDTFTTLPIGASFSDVCNVITLNGTHDFGVQFRGDGTYDPEQDAIIFPSISDAGYGQGPWSNPGAGSYVLQRVN
jgi:hypothetical protein